MRQAVQHARTFLRGKRSPFDKLRVSGGNEGWQGSRLGASEYVLTPSLTLPLEGGGDFPAVRATGVAHSHAPTSTVWTSS